MKMKFGICVAFCIALSFAQRGGSAQSTEPQPPAPASAITNSPADAPSTSVPPTTASPAPKAEAPAASPWPSWFVPGLVIRGRFEVPSGMNFAPNTTDAYYLSRMRPSVLIKPLPWLKFFGEGQDAREFGYNAPQQPANMYNPLDLRQAYVELGGEATRGVSLRVGQQELAFGSLRLIATPDWGNLSRTFDGAVLTISRSGAKAVLFGVSPALSDANRFDHHKAGDELYGGYFTFSKLLPHGTFETYVFERRQMKITGERGEIGNALLGTFGFRAIGTLPWRFDYSAELAHQWGPYANDHINALAGVYIAGWTVNGSARKPRFSLEYDHASGDGATKDGQRQTFDQMFPSTHGYYGIADVVGWRNMREARGGFELFLNKKLKLQADLIDFHLATTQDGLYTDSGTRTFLNRKATSTHVGQEVDLQGTYQFNKKLTFGLGFARLIPGEYLKQSSPGIGYNYPYVTWTYRPF
jgi:hypothetical protein